MHFWLNECINTDLITTLRGSGFDVITIRESELIGSSDEAVYDYAREIGRTLLTFDRGFGDIFRFNISNSPGIVIILMNQMTREEMLNIIPQFLSLRGDDLTGKLAIIGKSKIRISGQ